jgi:hypothetical protein
MTNRKKVRSDGTDAFTVATTPGQMFPLGYAQITDVSSVVSLTVPTGANFALVQVEGAPVRWRDDGVNPTATTGMRLTTTGELKLDTTLSAVRIIQEAAGAKLNISFYG